MQINDGDVFFWSWKTLNPVSQQAGISYWCMDQQCVAREVGGKMLLIDTYNYNPHQTEEIFGVAGFTGDYIRYLNSDKIDLEFKCNANELRVEAYRKDDYDTYYDLSYQKRCYKLFAVHKDAEPSVKAILAKKQAEKESLGSDVAYSLKKIQWLSEEIAELEGKL